MTREMQLTMVERAEEKIYETEEAIRLAGELSPRNNTRRGDGAATAKAGRAKVKARERERFM